MYEFIKLSDLVNNQFVINKVNGYKWKMWDNTERKMHVSDTWQKDYRKVWSVTTNKGNLDLSSAQMGVMLELVFRNGIANPCGYIFDVKSNGQTGKEIRYFFNIAKPLEPQTRLDEEEKEEPLLVDDADDINIEDIPF